MPNTSGLLLEALIEAAQALPCAIALSISASPDRTPSAKMPGEFPAVSVAGNAMVTTMP